MTRIDRQLSKARDDHAAAEVAYHKAKTRLDACAAIVKAYEAHPDAPNAVGRKIVVLTIKRIYPGERE